MIKKLPAGSQIYLTKKKQYTLYIQPDKTLLNDNLYVVYDVRADGQTIIPRGTRVVGDWVTESRPSIGAQLQLTEIFLQADSQKIMADSDVFGTITDFNGEEVGYADYFYQPTQYHATSNITRRIINFNTTSKTLLDNQRDIIYLEIPTKEIMVTLTEDFIAMPNLDSICPN